MNLCWAANLYYMQVATKWYPEGGRLMKVQLYYLISLCLLFKFEVKKLPKKLQSR